ncbi:sigma-54-dependent Fis family transcriptional regulator [Adhaeretor mobilis]|uniref:Alginate biosynthesis transcriptional regulatory protein AlgB n=1 Tax=Adhaeretor mobilis TaxID=1930276 RepID=A0A517MXD4_9BACT|nr:sigma-54-dependent Fis family transcriptional regulator [Adhaeretor mobilis]QDS99545.1 Alginate biosynthesis transcriptional regulatory protein AlgB [Adhaeretor mobilis]
MTKQHTDDELTRYILDKSSQASQIDDFLALALTEARAGLPAGALAVVLANPPQWQILAVSGVPEHEVPTDVAADALDKDNIAKWNEWQAAPLGNGYALVVRDVTDTSSLMKFASSLAAGMNTVRQTQTRDRRIRRLERILEVTHGWGQTNNMETLLHAMAEAATDLLEADRASIFLWDRANKQLVGRPALGVEDGELRIPDDAGIVGQVIHSGETRRVGGGLGDEEINRSVDETTGYKTSTVLCVPLTSPDGKLLGAFEVLNKKKGHFSGEDERGLTELAAHAAVALENTQQLEELLTKHQQLVEQAAEGVQMIGNSPAIEAVRSTTRRIADTDLAILILGENGTGKEVVAQSMHYISSRRDQPFIAVNCAALTETLLESELFGHEKGAFTDANEARAGKFELASGGTLFLDEIGDMSLSGQAKLLRVLEDKTVVRVGGSTPIHTEVRILAATNQDLAAMVREKKFREDLFFRLNVVSLELPPLRNRGDDVMLLAKHFLGTFCRTMGRKTPPFSAAAEKRLLAHRWPGNVRELRNLMERIAYLSTGESVEVDDLAFIESATGDMTETVDMNAMLSDATKQFQQQYIRHTIDLTKGNMSKAAKRLGLHRSNLYRKMRQLDMGGDEEE